MIWTIARKEATEMLRDQRFQWATGITLVLLLASLFVGWTHYTDVEAQRMLAQTSDREVWLNQGEKNQHSAVHFGTYAFKPNSPLTAMDRGVLPFTGVAVFMEGHRMADAQFRPAEDATAVQRLGSLTAASTLQILVPLLLILLAFATFAGEREQGTLRQLLSLGVDPRTLAAGKALGVVVPLLILIVPAAVLGVLSLMLLDGPEALSFGRFAMLLGIYVLYFALVLLLTLVVSARATSARSALVGLLGFWLLTTFVVPRLVTDAADAIHPTPDPITFQADIRTDLGNLIPWADRTKAVQERLMAEEGVDSVEELKASVPGHTLFEAERDETEVYRTHYADLAAQHDGQRGITQAGSLFAPYLAVKQLSMGLAGSDYTHHRHFAEAAEVYRYDYVQMLNQDMIDAQSQWGGTVGREMWEQVPEFTYAAPGAGWAVAQYGLSLGALGAWVLALGLMLPFTLGRMEVG
ncbi:MAG: ABC transporter permease subunit [Bacteroidota bacterium]